MGVPTYMYRRGASGTIEARVFDSDAIPKGEGWADSPAKLPTLGEPMRAEPARAAPARAEPAPPKDVSLARPAGPEDGDRDVPPSIDRVDTPAKAEGLARKVRRGFGGRGRR